MILRRSGGIRLLSFPHGDAEQVKGTFAATFFVSLMQLFSTGWMSLVLRLASSVPWPQAALSFCHAFFLFPYRHLSLLVLVDVLRSSGVSPACQPSHCLPFIISLSWLFLHQCFLSSSPVAVLAAYRGPVFLAGFLVKIKGAESVPLGAEE